jgi:hypothetical protein
MQLQVHQQAGLGLGSGLGVVGGKSMQVVPLSKQLLVKFVKMPPFKLHCSSFERKTISISLILAIK